MKTSATWIIIVAIVLLVGGFYLAGRSHSSPVPLYNTPAATTTEPTPAATSTDLSDLVRLSSPASGALIKSPLTLTGQARGNWYFEASFPIRIIDANGRELGRTAASAQGDWMTTEFVPFKATVTFATSSTATGFVVLEKDNPSGLPQNDASLKIPIRFQ